MNLYHYVRETNVQHWHSTWRFGSNLCDQLNKILPDNSKITSKAKHQTTWDHKVLKASEIDQIAELINLS